MKRLARLLMVAALILSVAGPNVAGKKAPKETAEEKKRRVVEWTGVLESDPFNKDAKDMREWLTQWLYEVPDVEVMLCSSFLGPVVEEKQKNGELLFLQSAFAQAVFVIENPDRAGDRYAEFKAGVLGSLRTYEAMIAGNPKLKLDHLDRLIEMRESGELDEYVREKIKACMG